MSAEEWWAPSLPEKFQQGDIFADIPFLLPPMEFKALAHANLKGNVTGFQPTVTARPDKNGRAQFVAEGPITQGMLLNHGCDIDKSTPKQKVMLALVEPIEKLPPEQREAVRAQRVVAQLYLPNVPSLGECFVDLRIITNVVLGHLKGKPRIASPSENAQIRIQAQLLTFFTRRKWTPGDE